LAKQISLEVRLILNSYYERKNISMFYWCIGNNEKNFYDSQDSKRATANFTTDEKHNIEKITSNLFNDSFN
jgi:hypothetical protein